MEEEELERCKACPLTCFYLVFLFDINKTNWIGFVCISEKLHGEIEAQHPKEGLSFTAAGNFTDKIKNIYIVSVIILVRLV